MTETADQVKASLQRDAPRWRQFYRYVGPAEAYAVESTRIVVSSSHTGITWGTPDRYATRADARRFLALPSLPTHRVGAVPEDELPPFAASITLNVRPVQPNFGEPGGGLEVAVGGPTYLFGIQALS